jgi:Xaa-Pro aminopeptidase
LRAERGASAAACPDEFRERRSRVAAGLSDRKLDALLVSQGANLRYLSGFTGSNGLLLLLPGEAILFTDPRYSIQAAQETTAAVRVCRGPLMADLIAALQRRRIRRLGFERARLSCEAFEALESKLPGKASLEPVSGWIERHRMIKSGRELQAIRAAVALNSQAFEQAVRRIRAGSTERDLAAELEYRMRRLGADKPAFETIVAVGERSALPHAQPTAAAVRTGGLLLVDMGAVRDGYCSDMTRMLFLGRPPAKVRRLYAAVLEAQLAALDAVRPGVTAAHVDRQSRRVLREHGLDRAFVHSTGHGLGLEIHEPPRLGKADKTRLETGMAITIEPGVYLEGFGGIRIEDTVAVTPGGCEILTPTPKELRTI